MDGAPNGRQLEVALMGCSAFAMALSNELAEVGIAASLQTERIGTALGPNGWAECRMWAADGSTFREQTSPGGSAR